MKQPEIPSICHTQFHLAYGIVSFLLGFALIMGGPQRVSAHAYSVLISQGGPYVWGTAFMVVGIVLLMSVDYPKLTKWMLFAGCILFYLLALSFLVAAFMYPDANWTATVAYTWIGSGHLLAFNKYRIMEPPDDKPNLIGDR